MKAKITADIIEKNILMKRSKNITATMLARSNKVVNALLNPPSRKDNTPIRTEAEIMMMILSLISIFLLNKLINMKIRPIAKSINANAIGTVLNNMRKAVINAVEATKGSTLLKPISTFDKICWVYFLSDCLKDLADIILSHPFHYYTTVKELWNMVSE